ncbi:hypothetical protein DMN91_008620 [Ooceraea biroi]|uniref:RNA-directed DNA polymerase from mobile element jockey n=1 Tax=Ooceraea biroi TaxID=2015173 RepID=A0A3L8DD27_OOCBI|nr:hypothetical protein DMN91_008620 [Ooceraea biroi]
MFVYNRHLGPPPPAAIRVGGESTPLRPNVTYLGLLLDGQWSFKDHFRDLAPRLEIATMALSRILPILRGPSEKTRRLLVGAVRSVALYGAPIWANDLAASNRSLQTCRVMALLLAASHLPVPDDIRQSGAHPGQHPPSSSWQLAMPASTTA